MMRYSTFLHNTTAKEMHHSKYNRVYPERTFRRPCAFVHGSGDSGLIVCGGCLVVCGGCSFGCAIVLVGGIHDRKIWGARDEVVLRMGVMPVGRLIANNKWSLE